MSIEQIKLDSAFVKMGLCRIDQSEYEFLKNYHMCMEPIAKALKILEGNRHTFGAYLPMLFGLKAKLKALKNTMTGKVCYPLTVALYNGFKRRFGKLLVLDQRDPQAVPLYIAMITNPTFKLNFMNSNMITANLLNQIRQMLFNAGK